MRSVLAAVVVAITLLGPTCCDELSPTGSTSAFALPNPPGSDEPSAAEELKVVREVVGKLMKLKADDIKPGATLAELKMSNLDYADALDSLETALKIKISKLELQKAAGTDKPYEVIDKLTIGKLAQTLRAIRARK